MHKPARQWFGFPYSQSHKLVRQWFGFPYSQSHKCHILKELSSYLDNQLESCVRLKVEEHLKTCKICSEELDRLKLLSSKLKTWQAPALNVSFDSSVRNKIVALELQGGRVKMKRKTLAVLIPSGALAGILIIAFFGVMGKFSMRSMNARLKQVSADKMGGSESVPQALNLLVQPSINEMKAYDMVGSASNSRYTRAAGSDNKYMNKVMGFAGSPIQGVSICGQLRDGNELLSPFRNTMGQGPFLDEFNTEQYDRIYDNDFLQVKENALSTFSIDVDTASYSNVRRFLTQNQMPSKDAVRIEELINYFTYDYPQPADNTPFSVTTEVSTCPWNAEHKLVLIGLQGRKMEAEKVPPSNLVFLIDVSGSMHPPNKLPLLKSAFRLLVNQLRAEDRVSIVVYAGSSGLVLDYVEGDQKQAIMDAIDRLEAGGSTAGGAGIQLAYEIAKKNYLKEGNNRVILATDGDFNVGVSSDADLTRIIEEKRNDGIFLSVLGFGVGNYKDAKMEKLADKGNGNLAYIDSLLEAKKVFVNQLTGTLFTIAKDVKIQVEFNPAKIKAYRLIGYENRLLKKEDFNDDKKDAGEIGAGHSVTALYEIVPPDSAEQFAGVDDLKYQQVTMKPSDELLTVKLRYKEPKEDTSKLIVKTITGKEKESQPSQSLNFASAVAEFGMILRDSPYKAKATYQSALERAKASKGNDADGYRAEFVKLVEIAQLLDTKNK